MAHGQKIADFGETLTVTAGGAITLYDVDTIGDALIGIALNAGVTGDSITYAIRGVYEMTCATGVAIAQGDQCFWNATTGVTETNTDTPLGIAYEAKSAGAGLNTAKVILAGVGKPHV